LAKNRGVAPAALDADRLVRTLCRAGFLISFFNDEQPLTPALQYFGTKGFFADYDARLAEPLKPATAKLWSDGLSQLRAGNLDPDALARAVARAESQPEASDMTGPRTRGAVLQDLWGRTKGTGVICAKHPSGRSGK
jgi:hypothetical protein